MYTCQLCFLFYLYALLLSLSHAYWSVYSMLVLSSSSITQSIISGDGKRDLKMCVCVCAECLSTAVNSLLVVSRHRFGLFEDN